MFRAIAAVITAIIGTATRMAVVLILLGVAIAQIDWAEMLANARNDVEQPTGREQVLTAAISSITETIRQNRKNARQVVVLPFEGDRDSYVTDNLSSALHWSGALTVVEEPALARATDFIVTDVLRNKPALSSPHPVAVRQMTNASADSALIGEIHRFERSPTTSYIDVEFTLVDERGGVILSDRVALEAPILNQQPLTAQAPSSFPRSGFTVNMDVLVDWVSWLLAVLLLPLFTIGFLRSAVRLKSNGANAMTLTLYTIIDGLLVLLLVGLNPTITADLVLLGAAMLIALAYNITAIGYAVRLEA